MTIEEFLGKLPKEGWFIVNRCWLIRRSDSGCCPIEFVAGLGRGYVKKASQELGLSESDTWSIINAADSPTARYRDRLREACGLVERNG